MFGCVVSKGLLLELVVHLVDFVLEQAVHVPPLGLQCRRQKIVLNAEHLWMQVDSFDLQL